MKQSQRVKIFGVGFLAGCIVAAGIAFLRARDEPPPPPPLPTWNPVADYSLHSSLVESLPKGLTPFRAWETSTQEIRWVGRDAQNRMWRVTQNQDNVAVIRADRLRVFGNPGIEIPALEAGLEHNGFEILEFDQPETSFVVPVSPFQPNAIEEARRLLESREPYIVSTEPIVFTPPSN